MLQLRNVQDILIGIVKKARSVQLKKTDDKQHFLRLFDDIIPNEYFGTRKHRKIFYRIIEKVLTRSKHECMYVNWFAACYNHNKVPWLTDQQKEDRNGSLFCVMIVGLLKIVEKITNNHDYFR